MNRRSCALISTIVFILLIFASVGAQDTTRTASILPTLSRNRPPWSVFPDSLYCEDTGTVSKGATWGNITIGSSTVQELKTYAASIYNYDVRQYADAIYFTKTGGLNDESGIPFSIVSCVDIDTQIITALKISTINRSLYLQDLVAQYDIPDTVTWGGSNKDRTVFWFKQGIAASVNIFEQNKMLAYGETDLIVYFPYQTNQGFDNRWPYNRTNRENPKDTGDVVYDSTPSQAENPFKLVIMLV